MKIVKVNLKERSYNIIIGDNLGVSLGKYIKALNIGTDAYIITNSIIKNKYGKKITRSLKKYNFDTRFKLVPDTEKSKSLEIVYPLIQDLIRYDKKKRVFIIAFGGGVIGDLAGFIASIYKRGTAYIQVPTTLLAQVDSAIGGKTAVDLAQGKNLVGAFYQPRLVASDTSFLKTLNSRQMQAGLAEVIKYALIQDPQLFRYLEKKYKDILSKKNQALEFIVGRSSKIKARVVSADEKEKKDLRTILNFGHTIGHAIETAGGYEKYNHGEAVALGMLVASRISKKLKLINPQTLARIKSLIEKVGLPVKIKKVQLKNIIVAHYRDKKFSGAKNKFVLIRGIGKTRVMEGVPLKIIKEALKETA